MASHKTSFNKDPLNKDPLNKDPLNKEPLHKTSLNKAPSDRDRLLLELESLEAFFCETEQQAVLTDGVTTAEDDIPLLNMAIPTLKDIVLKPDHEAGGCLHPPTGRSVPQPAPSPKVTPLSANTQKPNLDAAILPPIDPLPSAKPLDQCTQHLSSPSHAFPFLETIRSSSSGGSSLNSASAACVYKNPALKDDALKEDLMHLTVGDAEVDAILADIMTEVLPVIEHKLRNNLRRKLERMLSTQT